LGWGKGGPQFAWGVRFSTFLIGEGGTTVWGPPNDKAKLDGGNLQTGRSSSVLGKKRYQSRAEIAAYDMGMEIEKLLGKRTRKPLAIMDLGIKKGGA